ncbi:carboxymethylenebutenolidase [mine drainage metagenome]|uniref:Carboxymethylenebutenolidase n=1 Tax=mine drainage metagenome TaxID=410659 RepID=A0A1J5QEL2_9ZZZZ
MGSKVSFSSNGSTCEGYLAVPESGSGPGVIVIQEWWGLVGHITDVADRFAEAGFVALAPDLYHGVVATEPDDARRLLMGMAMDVAAADISGAADYLASLPSSSSPRIGTVGFCMGGSLALWSATLAPQVAAAVAFYPGFPWERMAPKWQNYQGKSAIIHCSEADGTSAAPGIQLAKTAIEGAGGQVELFDYPGTQHAFFNSDRPEVFDPKSSDLAWERTIEFFRKNLG